LISSERGRFHVNDDHRTPINNACLPKENNAKSTTDYYYKLMTRHSVSLTQNCFGSCGRLSWLNRQLSSAR